jgi:hypothetical protein
MAVRTIVLTELSGSDDSSWLLEGDGAIAVDSKSSYKQQHVSASEVSALVIVAGLHIVNTSGCPCAENLVAIVNASSIQTIWFHPGRSSSSQAMKELGLFLNKTRLSMLDQKLFRAYSLRSLFTVPSDVHLRAILNLVATGKSEAALEETVNANARRDSYLLRSLSGAELALFLDLEAVCAGLLDLEIFRDSFKDLKGSLNLDRIPQGITTALKHDQLDPNHKLKEVLDFWRKRLGSSGEVTR